MTKTKPFRAGAVVTSNFRVAPFLADDHLVVVSSTLVGRGRSAEWRVFCQAQGRKVAGAAVTGWLSADTLTPVR